MDTKHQEQTHLRLAQSSESWRILGTHSDFNFVCFEVNTQSALKRDQSSEDRLISRKSGLGAQFLFENVICFLALLPNCCRAVSCIPAARVRFKKLNPKCECQRIYPSNTRINDGSFGVHDKRKEKVIHECKGRQGTGK
jgi:hypothetical protein